MKYRSILLFGAPGAGKGTQGKILGAIPHFFHCACGDVFRGLRTDTELGRVFVEYSSRGRLVPDETTVTLWRESIGQTIAAGRFHPDQDTLVLDGIPRNAGQAKMLDGMLQVAAIFYLRSRNPENLIARIQRRALKENRLDDANLDVIRQRLKTYEKETKPVLKFYGKRLVHEINADQTPAKVLTDILRIAVKH
ncbi:MAG: nucleoside monophosphate kinase [Verrucomicrobiia bacterium]